MIKKNRIYGIDLLRVVSMLMIVFLHVLGHGGVVWNTGTLTANYYSAWVVYAFAFPAVNCYALISGYVGSNNEFKITNLIVLWLQVAFYSVSITVIHQWMTNDVLSLKDIVKAMLPVMQKEYWFFTAYFGMYLFTPVMNTAIVHLGQKQFSFVVFSIIIFFSIIPTVKGNDIYNLNAGYSMLWLMILYLIGGYIKKYSVFSNLPKGILGAIYLLCTLTTWGERMLFQYFSANNPSAIIRRIDLLSYCSPTTLFAAIALLVLFSKLEIGKAGKKIISVLSPMAFGVYLIHDNQYVRTGLIQNSAATFGWMSVSSMLLHTCAYVLFIFIICTLVELLRSRLFHLLNLKENIGLLEQKLVIFLQSTNSAGHR